MPGLREVGDLRPGAAAAVSGIPLMLPEEAVEAIAWRAAELVLAELRAAAPASPSPYMSVDEAAAYLRCDRQRIYDLLSARRLQRHKDGARVLISRAELEAYLAAP